jgi:CheY-like chemotaxis protein
MTAMVATTDETRVVVVGGGPEVLPFVEPLLAGGRYDVLFVGLDELPVASVREERPDLVVVCLRIEDAAGFQLLSMLRLDPVTSGIPVLTYTTEFEGQTFEGVDDEGPQAGAPRAPQADVVRLARH